MSAQALAAVRFRDAVYVARERRASDLHLVAGLAPVLRVDGELECLDTGRLETADVEGVAEAVARTPSQAGAESDFTVAWSDPEFGTLRIHVTRSLGAPAVAIRLLDASVPALESLQLPAAIAGFSVKRSGLLLFGGATGSGKSTTMAALVDRINRSAARRIFTVEDPIEYRHKNLRSIVSQRELGTDTPSMASAIRGMLRCDPDVIVVGEMRDAQSMEQTLIASETGHLVLATLHARDAVGTVDRFAGAFPAQARPSVRSRLAAALIAVVSQRLVKRASGSGRRAVVELLIATDAARALIRESRDHQLRNLIATGRQHGMQTFDQHLEELRRERAVAEEEAIAE
ncbi:MAG TPA: PilT/PilU family type 4a pilus ATPase [Verrucomicrobiae bacterium]|nr:PilT/PilU family type 4a pilus ATPase [Verrucomicrobiae bacterium]